MSYFDKTAPLCFLGLPTDGSYQPCPAEEPIRFLQLHLHVLPPHISKYFSLVTNPTQRSVLPVVRNRRLKYTQTAPEELSFASARSTWPTLWEGRERRGVEQGSEEKEWARNDFLAGSTQHIGKLGNLLGVYEEEREAQRVRDIRREAAASVFVPEEESDSDDDDDMVNQVSESLADLETNEDARANFERRVRERFIYGLLEDIDYDKVDWDESLDEDNDRDAEERWFDDDDEGDQ